jgi:hypothetical protein
MLGGYYHSMSLLAGSSVLNEMPPSKHIEHTTVDETPPDFSGNGRMMALSNRLWSARSSWACFLPLGVYMKVTIYETFYLQLVHYGGVQP